MTNVATIFGGSGFLGRYITQKLAARGFRIRVAVRRPNEAGFVRVYGPPGQIEPYLANVRYDNSVREAIQGSDTVINCVGILNQVGKQKFNNIHIDAAERIARFATELGVSNLVHISSLGSAPESESVYARTKALGEEAILRNYPDCTIFRPSVVFGNEDEFFNKFASMARLSPVLPLPGANARFQPVYVDDVAKAVEQAVFSKDIRGIYELGGNEILTLKELIDLMLEVIRRKRLVIPLPPEICSPLGWALDMVQIFSGGLVKNNLLTRDQLIQLGSDNVVSGDHPTLQDLKIAPTSLESVLEDYLYSYRPAGQFTAIHESSGGLGKNQDV